MELVKRSTLPVVLLLPNFTSNPLIQKCYKKGGEKLFLFQKAREGGGGEINDEFCKFRSRFTLIRSRFSDFELCQSLMTVDESLCVYK
jgi:hypothetical protein